MDEIRALQPSDVPEWHGLRALLWPDEVTLEETQTFAEELFAGRSDSWCVLVYQGDGQLDGFVEAHLREYADGCDSSPVGFIEGWYVSEPRRRVGIGRRLIDAAEAWARGFGCTEMASDALLENTLSHQAHEALGYSEVERAIRYRKDLT